MSENGLEGSLNDLGKDKINMKFKIEKDKINKKSKPSCVSQSQDDWGTGSCSLTKNIDKVNFRV